MARGLYWFSYTLPTRRDRETQAFQLRDGEASRCLTDALFDLGYRSKNTIINYPSPGPNLRPFDMTRFTEDDLILMTTRPAMQDGIIGDRRGIPRSYTVLEDDLFKEPLGKVFDCCARSQIRLADLIASISPEIAARQLMQFRQNGGAAYQAYSSRHRDWTRVEIGSTQTAAFLVYVEHAWPGGPAFLLAFGVGGTETLVWCRLLQTRFPELLCTKSFVMVELHSEAPKQPQTLDFADSWDVRILGTAPLGFLDDPAKAA